MMCSSAALPKVSSGVNDFDTPPTIVSVKYVLGFCFSDIVSKNKTLEEVCWHQIFCFLTFLADVVAVR